MPAEEEAMNARAKIEIGSVAWACVLSAGVAVAAPPKPGPGATEAWRVVFGHDLPLSATVDSAIAQADGGTLLAIDFQGTVTVPGHPPLTSRGERDVLLVHLDGAGQALKHHQVGGGGHDEVHGLAVAGGVTTLAMTSTGPITVGGETHRPPPAKMEYVAEYTALLVALDPSGQPTRALRAWPGPRKIHLAAAPSGDLLASTYTYSMDDDREFADVHRISPAGKPIWSRRLDAPEVSAVGPLGDRVAVATLGKRALGVVQLDLSTGAVIAPPLRSVTQPAGDRGEIVGVVATREGPVAIGHTGRRAVTVAGGPRLSHPIEPFSLDLAGAATDRRSLVDAVATVEAVGVIGGEPASIIHVINPLSLYGGRHLRHRGVFLTIGHPPRNRFVGLFTSTYGDARDRGQTEPTGTSTVVIGRPIVPFGGRFVPGGVLIWGQCGAPERACLVRFDISG